MSFVRGSCHRPRGDFKICDASQSAVASWIAADGAHVAHFGAMSAGDAIFHAGWTLHRAEANPTTTMREVMTVIYFADGMGVAPPANEQQESDLLRWIPGCRPGEPAAIKLNPTVGENKSQ